MTVERRILLAGDTHGIHSRGVELIDAAVAAGCGRILQLGDFGWFPNARWGQEFIANLDAYAQAAGVTFSFIGGNHDNWEDLTRLTAQGELDADGLILAGSALRYIPRPHRWQWAGVCFGALGGAWSIDRHRRTAFIDWWPDEQPCRSDALGLANGGPLDVAVFHDAPSEVDLSIAGLGGNDIGGGRDTRILIDGIIEACTPAVVFHGHWHIRHSTQLAGGCRVEGLADASSALSEQVTVFDLDNLEVVTQAPALPTRLPWGPCESQV